MAADDSIHDGMKNNPIEAELDKTDETPSDVSEQLDTQGVANEPTKPELESEGKDSTPDITSQISRISDAVDTVVLPSPSTTIPRFAMAMLQKRQFDIRALDRSFKARRREMGFGGDQDVTTPPSPSGDTPTSARRSTIPEFSPNLMMGMLSAGSNIGTYQELSTTHRSFMRKQLSVSYYQAAMLKTINKTMIRVGDIVESKLEAIKMNTAAPSDKKSTYSEKVAAAYVTLRAQRDARKRLDRRDALINNYIKAPLTSAVEKLKSGATGSDVIKNGLQALGDRVKSAASSVGDASRGSEAGAGFLDRAANKINGIGDHISNKTFSDKTASFFDMAGSKVSGLPGLNTMIDLIGGDTGFKPPTQDALDKVIGNAPATPSADDGTGTFPGLFDLLSGWKASNETSLSTVVDRLGRISDLVEKLQDCACKESTGIDPEQHDRPARRRRRASRRSNRDRRHVPTTAQAIPDTFPSEERSDSAVNVVGTPSTIQTTPNPETAPVQRRASLATGMHHLRHAYGVAHERLGRINAASTVASLASMASPRGLAAAAVNHMSRHAESHPDELLSAPSQAKAAARPSTVVDREPVRPAANQNVASQVAANSAAGHTSRQAHFEHEAPNHASQVSPEHHGVQAAAQHAEEAQHHEPAHRVASTEDHRPDPHQGHIYDEVTNRQQAEAAANGSRSAFGPLGDLLGKLKGGVGSLAGMALPFLGEAVGDIALPALGDMAMDAAGTAAAKKLGLGRLFGLGERAEKAAASARKTQRAVNEERDMTRITRAQTRERLARTRFDAARAATGGTSSDHERLSRRLDRAMRRTDRTRRLATANATMPESVLRSKGLKGIAERHLYRTRAERMINAAPYGEKASVAERFAHDVDQGKANRRIMRENLSREVKTFRSRGLFGKGRYLAGHAIKSPFRIRRSMKSGLLGRVGNAMSSPIVNLGEEAIAQGRGSRKLSNRLILGVGGRIVKRAPGIVKGIVGGGIASHVLGIGSILGTAALGAADNAGYTDEAHHPILHGIGNAAVGAMGGAATAAGIAPLVAMLGIPFLGPVGVAIAGAAIGAAMANPKLAASAKKKVSGVFEQVKGFFIGAKPTVDQDGNVLKPGKTGLLANVSAALFGRAARYDAKGNIVSNAKHGLLGDIDNGMRKVLGLKTLTAEEMWGKKLQGVNMTHVTRVGEMSRVTTNGGVFNPGATITGSVFNGSAGQGANANDNRKIEDQPQFQEVFRGLDKDVQKRVLGSQMLKYVIWATDLAMGAPKTLDLFKKEYNAEESDQTIARKMLQARTTKYEDQSSDNAIKAFKQIGREQDMVAALGGKDASKITLGDMAGSVGDAGKQFIQPMGDGSEPHPHGNKPRGIRNNNPGNLNFVGQKGAHKEDHGDSSRFAAFDTMADGIRALRDQLMIYGRRGINTIEGIISKYAPPSENNTQGYIAGLSQRVGAPPNAPLNMADIAVQQQMISGISRIENGPGWITLAQIKEALGGGTGGDSPSTGSSAPSTMMASASSGASAPIAAPSGTPAPTAGSSTPSSGTASSTSSPIVAPAGMAMASSTTNGTAAPSKTDTKVPTMVASSGPIAAPPSLAPVPAPANDPAQTSVLRMPRTQTAQADASPLGPDVTKQFTTALTSVLVPHLQDIANAIEKHGTATVASIKEGNASGGDSSGTNVINVSQQMNHHSHNYNDPHDMNLKQAVS